MVMDKGLSLNEAENMVALKSELTDIVKLGFGTSLLTRYIDKKENDTVLNKIKSEIKLMLFNNRDVILWNY